MCNVPNLFHTYDVCNVCNLYRNQIFRIIITQIYIYIHTFQNSTWRSENTITIHDPEFGNIRCNVRFKNGVRLGHCGGLRFTNHNPTDFKIGAPHRTSRLNSMTGKTCVFRATARRPVTRERPAVMTSTNDGVSTTKRPGLASERFRGVGRSRGFVAPRCRRRRPMTGRTSDTFARFNRGRDRRTITIAAHFVHACRCVTSHILIIGSLIPVHICVRARENTARDA